jgi:phosphoribosylanthranilate isomerase
MTKVQVKICGLTTHESLDAAVRFGASHVGLVFFDRSPRNITPEQALGLAAHVPMSVQRVGVFVDPDDALLDATAGASSLTGIQLHGAETLARIADLKARFGLPVWKAIGVRTSSDLDAARAYEAVADLLLFDAKPPKPAASDDMSKGCLPGGLGTRFDWRLLDERRWKIPWGLSGGLDASTVAIALRDLRPDLVDVSSGVEDAPGQKSVVKIEQFLKATRL